MKSVQATNIFRQKVVSNIECINVCMSVCLSKRVKNVIVILMKENKKTYLKNHVAGIVHPKIIKCMTWFR